MPEPNKNARAVGLLAHVSASRGEPHFYSPEKFEFLRAFAFLGKYRLRFVLRGIIDIEAVPRYNDCTKTEAPYISGISTSMRYAIASSSLEQMT